MRLSHGVVVLVLSLSAVGCGLQGLYGSASPSARPAKVMVFGGNDHQTYLGCISCADTVFDSIFNDEGPYGAYGCTAKFNCKNLFTRMYPNADFGGDIYGSKFSACYSSASDPPVVVDQNGGYYGRFSIAEGWLAHKESVCQDTAFSSLYKFANPKVCEIAKWACGRT